MMNCCKAHLTTSLLLIHLLKVRKLMSNLSRIRVKQVCCKLFCMCIFLQSANLQRAICQTTFQILKKIIELQQLMPCVKTKYFNALLHLHSCSLKKGFQIPKNNLLSDSNFNLLILFFSSEETEKIQSCHKDINNHTNSKCGDPKYSR